MKDIYQERYLEHIDRKQKYECVGNYKHSNKDIISLLDVMQHRRSQRVFNFEDITEKELDLIKFSVINAPSSCNRQAIYLKEEKPEYIEKHFRGANKWGKNASKCYLVLAHKEAYKNPKELPFMPYLDAGVVVENIYLMCEVLNIGCCFVNPNCNLEFEDYICGAIMLGKYDKKAIEPPKRSEI